MSSDLTWVPTLPAELVAREGVSGCVAGGEPVALYCVEGVFYATADVCTHGQALLSAGYLDGHLIECPLHQGLFDVRDGTAAGPPCTQPVQSFACKVVDGVVMVAVD